MEGNQEETHLFLLRLWLEAVPLAESEHPAGGRDNEAGRRWQGRGQYIGRGEAHAFTGWEMLIGRLEAMLLRASAF